MLTVRQIERYWNASDFGRLARELLAGRAESARTLLDCSHRVPAAAWSVIRMDELGQGYQPLAGKLIRVLLAAQDADGGWGDVATTALVLRALTTCDGFGVAIDRGLRFLGMLQKDDGTWPRVPIKRMDSDEETTRAVVGHLAYVRQVSPGVDVIKAKEALVRDRVAGKIGSGLHRHANRMAQLTS